MAWTDEDERDLQNKLEKKRRAEELSNYLYNINIYFHNYIRNIELLEDTINGESMWLHNHPSYMTISSIEGKFNIDDEELSSDIYFCMTEKDGYYCVYRSFWMYFEYKDKIYELVPETQDLDIRTGNFNVWCDIYEFDKSLFNLDFSSVELYHDGIHPNMEELRKAEKRCSHMTLNSNTNLIAEVIKKMKEEQENCCFIKKK